MPPKKEESETLIRWTTISYRSVAVMVFIVLVFAAIIMHFMFPNATKGAMDSVSGVLSSMTSKIGTGGGDKSGQAEGDTRQQAHFTGIDGTVKVKRAATNSWVQADFSIPLEKGDVVQTGSEGMAKVTFADGTNYTVKQDSLIVIEENSMNAARQSQVAVQVTTGTVDLTTATFSQGSRSQVTVAGATATLAPESAAQVKNDPRADSSEILLKKGNGEVTRGSEVVKLGTYEKVSFQPSSTTPMTKEKETGPPTLISPANMMPIFATAQGAAVTFAWTPVPNSTGYRLRISKNPYFTSLVTDKKVTNTELAMGGLGEGAYYWAVQTLAGAKESVESERNRFTIIPKSASNSSLALELDSFVQHGHVIEVRGRTEPTARVMVNGQEVPMIKEDGTFNFFTPPLPNGENVITVTSQNAKGGVATKQKTVVIQ